MLISVGGAYTEPGFVGATSSENLNKFVYNLVGFMVQRKYDGIDIDWEPINPQDYEQFKIFVSTLRGVIGQHYLLTTTAVQGYGPLMASMQNYFDQINIMTYDLSFPSQGWITWYSGALYQNGVTFPSTGGPLPACDNIVSTFISAGVVRNKIGIGIEFGGSIWKGGLTSDGKGVTGPGQSWEVAPTIIPDVPYYIIMRDYYSPERYHWDQGAQSSYLSIDSASAVKDYFISYDDAKDISAKITYVKKNNLGGVIIYELGMGYLGKGKSVAGHIGSVTDAAASTGAMAGQTLSAAEELSLQSARLRTAVDDFIRRVRVVAGSPLDGGGQGQRARTSVWRRSPAVSGRRLRPAACAWPCR